MSIEPSKCNQIFIRPGECGRVDRALSAYNMLTMLIASKLPCDPATEFDECDEPECKWHDVCEHIYKAGRNVK